jgi:hypothetical protein
MEEEQKEVVAEVEPQEIVEEQAPTKEEEEKLRQERVAACSKEIGTILQRYECSLDASIMLRAGQVMPNIQIVPIELMRRNKPV